MAYWRSSSGALSFRSNVSMATSTLDTWLGLSGRNRQLRTESHTCGQLMPHQHRTRRASVPRQAGLNVPAVSNGARLTSAAASSLPAGV